MQKITSISDNLLAKNFNSQKNTSINEINQNPKLFLQDLIAEIESNDSTGNYNLVISQMDIKQKINNLDFTAKPLNPNSLFPALSSNLKSQLDTLSKKLKGNLLAEFESQSTQNDSIEVVAFSNNMKKTIGGFEKDIIINTSLTLQEKEIIFTATTAILSNMENIISLSVLINEVSEDSEDKFFRRLWRGITNVARFVAKTVVVVATIAVSITIAAIETGIQLAIIGAISLNPKIVLYAFGIGAALGAVYALFNVPANNCYSGFGSFIPCW